MTHRECSLHPRSTLDTMNAFKDEQQFCDIIIMAGQDEIKVHKFVLIAASEYFRAMFSSDSKESKTGIVSFSDTPSDVVTQCINFIYSGKAEFSLDRITDFIKASDIFCLHTLTNLYVEFFSENIAMDNVEKMLSVARVYQKELLKASIQEFFRENLKAFVESQELHTLPKDDFLDLLSLVHNWGKKYEMLKWNAIVTWVHGELGERKDAFLDLFDTIDFSFVPRKFIKDDVICEPLVSESAKLMFKICDTVLEEKPSKMPMVTVEKHTGIISCNTKTGVVYRYSLIEDEWSAFTQLPQGIETTSLDVAEYKGAIYITMGNAIFNFNGMEWKKLYGSDSGGEYNRCIGWDKYIVMITQKRVVMHENNNAKTSSIDIVRRSHCSDFAIATTEESIYVIGGTGGPHGANSYDSFEIDLITMQCGRISNIPISVGRGKGCVFGFNGIVYGFSIHSDKVVYYNDIKNDWQCITDVAIKYTVGCKVHIADKMYLYGGELGTEIQTVELEKLMVSERDKHPALQNVDMKTSCISFLK